MMGLFASELRRLTSRRLVLWLLLVAIGLAVLLVVLVTAKSDPNRVGDDLVRTTQLWLSRSAALDLGVQRDQVIATTAVLTYLLVIVIGASAVGAEYRAGTVTTILTWEPRRVRLLIVRLAATALVAMAFFLIVHLVVVGGWALGASIRGETRGADVAFWGELATVLARATLLAGVLAVLSGAIATVGRNTAAAMGVWFGYLIVVEAIVRGRLENLVPWFLTGNAGAFFAWEPVRQNGHVITAGSGAARMALYFVLIGGAAVAVFARRDVT